MKALIVAAALVVGVGAAGVAQAQEDLAKSAGCLSHPEVKAKGDDVKTLVKWVLSL